MDTAASSVSNLPTDILCRIFIEHCESYRVDCESEEARCAQPVYKDGGCSVALVCRRWREVALANAEMWTFISIPDYSLEQVAQYLVRSKKRGLTVILTFKVDSLYTLNERKHYNSGIIKVFEFHKDRIVHLAFYDLANWNKSQLLFMDLLTYAAVGLKHLRMHGCPVYEKSISGSMGDAVVSCRSTILSELVLSGLTPLVPDLSDLDVANLSHLVLENTIVYTSYIRRLLERVPRLQNLELLDVDIMRPDVYDLNTDNLVPIHLNHLNHIHLDINALQYPIISGLVDISDAESFTGRMGFTAASGEVYRFILENHLSVLDLNSDEAKITVSPVDNYVLLLIGKYQLRIERSRSCASVWSLCEELFKLLHGALRMNRLKSLELNFHRLDSSIYKSSSDEFGRCSSSSISMEALKGFIMKAGNLQTIRISLRGILENTDNEDAFISFQIKFMMMLYSLLPNLPFLKTLILRDFVYGEDGKFLDILKFFLSAWKNPNTILHIEDAHLYPNCVFDPSRELRGMVGELYISGCIPE